MECLDWLRHYKRRLRRLSLAQDKGKVIVTFFKRKNFKQVPSVKNDLRKLNTADVDLPDESRIFTNQSLCSYHYLLWSASKKHCIVRAKSLAVMFLRDH